jgi:hypothetical protein
MPPDSPAIRVAGNGLSDRGAPVPNFRQLLDAA